MNTAKTTTPLLNRAPNRMTAAAGQPAQSEASLVGKLIAATQTLNARDIERLIVCATILERHRGDTTPLEEFICDLLGRYEYFDGAVQPDYIESSLKEFILNHSEAVALARMMARRFPDEVLGPPGGSPGGAEENN